jgi:hypothetical protein
MNGFVARATESKRAGEADTLTPNLLLDHPQANCALRSA